VDGNFGIIVRLVRYLVNRAAGVLLKVKAYSGSVAQLNCRLEALQFNYEQKQTSVDCLQTKYDAERVCALCTILQLAGLLLTSVHSSN